MDRKPSPRKGPHLCSLRCGLAVVMHLSNLAMITQRVSLSIAVIAMVNGTQQPAAANASTDRPHAEALQDPGGPLQELGAGSSVYAWSPETQGIIFSSISYGLILTLVPSGYLAGIFGAKRMLGAGLLVSSLLTLFTPWAADLGVTLLVVVRTIQGMAQVARHLLPRADTGSCILPWTTGLRDFHCREWHGQVSLPSGRNGPPHWNEAGSPASRGQGQRAGPSSSSVWGDSSHRPWAGLSSSTSSVASAVCAVSCGSR